MFKKKEYHIVYATDDGYAMQTGVSITSLLENNLDAEDISIYILDSGISQQNKELIIRTVELRKRRIFFVDVHKIVNNMEKIGARAWTNGSFGAYSRLFVNQCLGHYNLDKVIYLDSDIIVNYSLYDFWNHKMKESSVCAMVPMGDLPRDYCLKIGFKEGELYYNTGAILFDLNNWRIFECEKIITTAISNNSASYYTADQDMLNVLFADKIEKLPISCNVFPEMGFFDFYTIKKYYAKNKNYYSFEHYDYFMKQKKPIIIHYCNSIFGKPWYKDSITPWKKEWRYWLDKSEWASDFMLMKRHIPISFFVIRFFCSVLPGNMYFLMWKTWQKIRGYLFFYKY